MNILLILHKCKVTSQKPVRLLNIHELASQQVLTPRHIYFSCVYPPPPPPPPLCSPQSWELGVFMCFRPIVLPTKFHLFNKAACLLHVWKILQIKASVFIYKITKPQLCKLPDCAEQRGNTKEKPSWFTQVRFLWFEEGSLKSFWAASCCYLITLFASSSYRCCQLKLQHPNPFVCVLLWNPKIRESMPSEPRAWRNHHLTADSLSFLG